MMAWLVLAASVGAGLEGLGNKLVDRVGGRVDAWNRCNREWWVDHGSKKMIDALAETGIFHGHVGDPVLHLRCSDVPFSKHPDYPFPPPEYYEWVATLLAGRFSRLTILSCPGLHVDPGANQKYTASDVKKTCHRFVGEIKTIFSRFNITVFTACELSIRRSVRMMLSAAVLVSTGGSFSFVPGIARTATGRMFLSPNFRNCPGRISFQYWRMYPGRIDFDGSIDYFNYSLLA